MTVAVLERVRKRTSRGVCLEYLNEERVAFGVVVGGDFSKGISSSGNQNFDADMFTTVELSKLYEKYAAKRMNPLPEPIWIELFLRYQELPEESFELLNHCVFGDLTVQQISERINLSLGGTKKRIARVKEILKVKKLQQAVVLLMSAGLLEPVFPSQDLMDLVAA